MTTQPSTSQNQTQTQTQPLDSFREALDLIVKAHGASQDALTLVFRACLKDLFHSKSTERLNQAARALSALPVWAEFCRRVRLAYGGAEFDGDKVYDCNGLSCVHYVRKFNGFIRQDMPENSFRSHLQFFDSKLSSLAWNEYKYARKSAPALITAKDVKAAYLKIRDNRASWSAEERATLERVLTALVGIFD